MRAALIVLFALLVLLHPAAVVLVLGAELAAIAVLGCLIRRGLRFRSCPHIRRLA